MNYDRSDAKSIEEYGKKLIGKSFTDVLMYQHLTEGDYEKYIEQYGNPRRKGGLGNFLEEVYFGYKANSDSRADFHEAGVELKVSPYEINKKKQLRVGERLVLTMISYTKPVEHDFITSHLWEKVEKILLVYYLRNRDIQCNLDYRIDYVSLFSPSATDLEIIKQDYKIIIDKVESGRAHELSESDTMYLAACTKGSTAEKSTVPQEYYNPSQIAKKRAFSFKQSYMNIILKQMIENISDEMESIIDDSITLENSTFSEYISHLINKHSGKSDKQLCHEFNREYNNNKAQWNDLSYRMLGIKSNKAIEFVKANIVVKTIRVEKNGKIKENISLPHFKFMDLIQEEWDDSTIHNYFDETKFLFIVFKKQGSEYILSHCKLWNMPKAHLEQHVKVCWNNTINIVKEGIQFTKKGNIIKNNLPNSSDNKIMHVRPHAQKSAYQLKDGYKSGSLTTDGDLLPDGQWMTKQSFWLNNSYIKEEIIEK